MPLLWHTKSAALNLRHPGCISQKRIGVIEVYELNTPRMGCHHVSEHHHRVLNTWMWNLSPVAATAFARVVERPVNISNVYAIKQPLDEIVRPAPLIDVGNPEQRSGRTTQTKRHGVTVLIAMRHLNRFDAEAIERLKASSSIAAKRDLA